LDSEGEYIAFLDDDDEWLPDKLQKQVEVLDHSQPTVCGVHSGFLIIDKITDKIVPYDLGKQKIKGNLLNQLSMGDPIKTSSVLLRKRCLDKVGLFDETISYLEDRDLWIRLSVHYDFEYIPKPLIKYYVHDNAQLTKNIVLQTAGREKLLERYQHLFKTNKRYHGKLYVQLGVQYCQLKKMSAGRKNIIKGIKIYPFKMKAYLHLFSSFFGPSNYQRLRNFYKSAQIKL
jgi:glycosyltransferase involved in cell wall biosynthesis